LAFGIALIILTDQIVEYSQRYDQLCKDKEDCQISVKITNEMKGPVFFYYELDNFYQNHRRYVKSRDVDQLKGTIKSGSELSDCEPVIYMRDLGIKHASLKDDDPANPCGLIAKSLFNGEKITNLSIIEANPPTLHPKKNKKSS
jgi:hypothetical protein